MVKMSTIAKKLLFENPLVAFHVPVHVLAVCQKSLLIKFQMQFGQP